MKNVLEFDMLDLNGNSSTERGRANKNSNIKNNILLDCKLGSLFLILLKSPISFQKQHSDVTTTTTITTKISGAKRMNT